MVVVRATGGHPRGGSTSRSDALPLHDDRTRAGPRPPAPERPAPRLAALGPDRRRARGAPRRAPRGAHPPSGRPVALEPRSSEVRLPARGPLPRRPHGGAAAALGRPPRPRLPPLRRRADRRVLSAELAHLPARTALR